MKGLEALEHLKDVLYGLPEKDNLVIIEKELKALEIIKNKAVNCYDVMFTTNYKHYLIYMKEYNDEWKLTKKEYNLLKEVLEE